jgi:hypothetical protein
MTAPWRQSEVLQEPRVQLKSGLNRTKRIPTSMPTTPTEWQSFMRCRSGKARWKTKKKKVGAALDPTHHQRGCHPERRSDPSAPRQGIKTASAPAEIAERERARRRALSVLQIFRSAVDDPVPRCLDRRQHRRQSPDLHRRSEPEICKQQFRQKEMSTSASSRSAAQPAGAGRSASELAGIGARLARAREGSKHDQRVARTSSILSDAALRPVASCFTVSSEFKTCSSRFFRLHKRAPIASAATGRAGRRCRRGLALRQCLSKQTINISRRSE